MSKVSAKERDAFARIDALYARLPTMTCQGRCAIACGRIPLTDLEARRLQLITHTKPRTVLRLRPDATPIERCVYLTADDRCSAYAVRPLLCRVYGVTRLLSCPHGCIPDRWLTELEFVALAQEVERISGGGRLLRTELHGLVVGERSFAGIGQPARSAEAIEKTVERTRHLRALHGGFIQIARHDDDDDTGYRLRKRDA